VTARRYAVGPECRGDGLVDLRVWAPGKTRVLAMVGDDRWPMHAEEGGYWSGTVSAATGARYGFVLDDDPAVWPDPASRWQPDGVEAASAVWDPGRFAWTDHGWPGLVLRGQVLYELHLGTYTREGTWRAAARHLPELATLGITAVQVMPVNAFAGTFGWGYDGVFWCAPAATYGRPDAFQEFVDAAHAAGLGVILDVVFNHLGPAGNVLPRYASHYVAAGQAAGEWGDALNFSGEGAQGLRDLIVTTAQYWVREFHVDGLRLDAVQAIADDSAEHIVAQLTAAARDAARPRTIVVLAEHEPQHARLVRRPSQGGYGLDGVYLEDFHHSMRVALTGVREAYLSDYDGSSREWLSLALHGFLFQGQHYAWQGQPRGAPALDIARSQLIAFLENHDQVANISGRRLRDQTSASWLRAMSAVLLMGPWTPLLFQGQEWGASEPFRYFCDHAPGLQEAVADGRQAFLAQFTRRAAPGLPQPGLGREVFETCLLDHPPEPSAVPMWRLHRDALALRGTLRFAERALSGSAPASSLLLLRPGDGTTAMDALLVVNLGADRRLEGLSDPLVAPHEGCTWRLTWCSEDPAYGGGGIARAAADTAVVATGHATSLFLPAVCA
jgi:maltooligosyltrehalose trehalohydrolase